MSVERAVELLREKSRRVERYSIYTPDSIEGHDQLSFHKNNKYIRLLAGGNQSGKSMSGAQEIAWWATGTHPYRQTEPTPVEIWVISTEYTTIRSGIYRHLMTPFPLGSQLIPEWEVEQFGPKIQGTEIHGYIKMKNGSIIRFMSAKGAEDAREKFQAAKVALIAIDEEINRFLWDELQVRQFATTRPSIIITATLVKSEPWIVELETQGEADNEDVHLVRLDTTKNIHIEQSQVQRFIAKYDEETIRYRIRGFSRRYQGLIYKHFNKTTHVIKNFSVPREWTHYFAFDPGFRTSACLYIAVSPDNTKYIYKEIYEHQAELVDVVDLIRASEGWLHRGYKQIGPLTIKRWVPGPNYTPIYQRIIDDKRGRHTITGELGPLEQLSQFYGVECEPAFKAKTIGIERCRASLRLQPKSEILVFDTCTNFINEIEQYRAREDKSKQSQNSVIDEPIKRNDHLLDCWRYIMMVEPEYTEADVKYEEELEDDEEVHSQDFDINEWRKRKYSNSEACGLTGHPVAGDY